MRHFDKKKATDSDTHVDSTTKVRKCDSRQSYGHKLRVNGHLFVKVVTFRMCTGAVPGDLWLPLCLVQIPILTTISTYALPFQEDLQSTGYLSRLVARGFVDSLLVRLIHLALLQLPIRDDPCAALVSAFAVMFLIYVKRSNHHINICPLNN